MNIFDQKYLEYYKNFKYLDTIITPGFKPEPKFFDPNASSVKNFYGHRLLQEFEVEFPEQKDKLAYVDKLFPHSFLDTMVLAADENPKSSFFSLGKQTNTLLLEMIHNFLEFVSDKDNIKKFNLENGHVHFCYNYDPDTKDRESGMSYEDRFHLHMNYWSGRELALVNEQKFSDLKNLSYKKRLIDPGTYLGERIIYQKLQGEILGVKLVEPDIDKQCEIGLPAGIKVRFSGWSFLKEDLMRDVMRELHRVLENTYKEITNIFLEEKNELNTLPWQRRRLRNREEIIEGISSISWADNCLKNDLIIFAKTLRDLEDHHFEYFKSHETHRIRHMSLGGLNYSLGLYSQGKNSHNLPIIEQGPIYIVAQTKLFADIGGAGLPYLSDIPVVRISRKSGTFNEFEVKRRKQFHEDFICFNNTKLSEYKEVKFLNHLTMKC